MLTSPPLPPEAEQQLRSELHRDEELLWAGQPRAGRFPQGSLPLFLMGIPWTAFCLFWETAVIMITVETRSRAEASQGMPVWFPLVGALFVLFGLWMLSAPYWMRHREQKTVYAVTDKRALIISPAWRNTTSIRSIPPEHLRPRTRTRNGEGAGSLFFTLVTVTRRSAGPDGRTYEAPVGFENIADLHGVEALIEQIFRVSS